MQSKRYDRIADQWAYFVRYLSLLRWCAGQAQALRCGYRRPQRFRDVSISADHYLRLEGDPTAASSCSTKKPPPRRLKWIASTMPTLKAELVKLCTNWNVWLPDVPQNMRVVDLQQALWDFDAKLDEDTIDLEVLAKSWDSTKITFGNKYRGETYQQVSSWDPGYCEWIRTSAPDVTEAMKQFIRYLEIKENMRTKEAEDPEERGPRRPRTRVRRTSEVPMQGDANMADAARKRASSEESWEDVAL